MLKKLFFILFIAASFPAFSQNLKISGNTNDTATKQSLPNAVLMAIRFSDSTLVNYTRSDKDGIFKPITLPLDTYIVIISHSAFSDKTYLLLPNKNDSVFRFKNVVLPPKSVQLTEVEIVAYKDKMYYKGDTLQFTADSFKVRPNATVEDLLKKLPGVTVDAKGKITIQGKTVDQVLVDGDEFFGSDPTIATRNLNANTVETVQVFEKKNENTEDNTNETLKIVNLKLKEAAKKGYFGKLSGASDFKKFYENDVLINKFKNSQKISLFGLLANTPKQAFSWDDAYKYGINNNGGTSYDPETNSWTSMGDNSNGVPQTLKSGFYYNDKIGKNTKINSDYTFNQNQLVTGSEINTQYFLPDTNYTNKQVLSKTSNNQAHNFNFKISTKLDSLTELTIRPKVNYNKTGSTNLQIDDFITETGETTRSTSILNKGNSETTDANMQIKVQRLFAKKDRSLTLSYLPSYYDSQSKNDLTTNFRYFQGQLPDSNLVQKRTYLSHKQEQTASLTYFEPLTKKWKTEVGYGFSHSLGNNTQKTMDFDGQSYDNINPLQSNDFRNTRIANRVGAKIIYDVKKYRISLGANYRNTFQENVNVTQNQTLTRSFNNVLPYANFNYRINQGSNLNVTYNSQTQLPDLQQMQPVVDNSDPNRIRIGNPDLKIQFENQVNVNYYFYKGVSDVNFYSGAWFSQKMNEINEKNTFDSLGRVVITPVNINGNYNGNMWSGFGFPLFKRFLKMNINMNASISKNNSFVNNVQNTTNSYGIYPSLNLQKQTDWMDINIGGSYNYDITNQTINSLSDQTYYSYGLNGSLMFKLPKKFSIGMDATYTDNGNRTPGYNINYVIVNASISKTFMKNENLVISAEGFDIFNQNISNQRTVETNRIIDTKTRVIRQYFLLRAVYKFTSQKTKEGEGDED